MKEFRSSPEDEVEWFYTYKEPESCIHELEPAIDMIMNHLVNMNITDLDPIIPKNIRTAARRYALGDERCLEENAKRLGFFLESKAIWKLYNSVPNM